MTFVFVYVAVKTISMIVWPPAAGRSGPRAARRGHTARATLGRIHEMTWTGFGFINDFRQIDFEPIRRVKGPFMWTRPVPGRGVARVRRPPVGAGGALTHHTPLTDAEVYVGWARSRIPHATAGGRPETGVFDSVFIEIINWTRARQGGERTRRSVVNSGRTVVLGAVGLGAPQVAAGAAGAAGGGARPARVAPALGGLSRPAQTTSAPTRLSPPNETTSGTAENH
ncbi:hypothetical protein EVAR_44489_1 [Eumeta japonica]|uniref:Uncharacterized protein n=1 Tax=Eumeta variegata TaxID=151549 RepID=A0A4C1WKG0_EUMVA|nr:hypothetical protein EVAR_44489_1 [Eumeta japonica]